VTTRFPLLPNTQQQFQFQPTLDGTIFQASVPWNLSGQRYYINLIDPNGIRVMTLPLVGSRDAVSMQNITWKNGIVTVTTTVPHQFMMGKTIDLYVLGVLPVEYNGLVRVLVSGLSEVQYKLTANPGPYSQLGVLDYVLNLAAGYFTSTMVFRSSNATFEINP